MLSVQIHRTIPLPLHRGRTLVLAMCIVDASWACWKSDEDAFRLYTILRKSLIASEMAWQFEIAQ